MKLEVKCTVNNCHYWKQGNLCHANQIMVSSDEVGANKPDSYDASTMSTTMHTPTKTCVDTCCKTFVPKNSNKINADGVTTQ